MKKVLKRPVFDRYYFVGTKKIDGAPDCIRGDLSGIRGDLSGISGDLSGIRAT